MGLGWEHYKHIGTVHGECNEIISNLKRDIESLEESLRLETAISAGLRNDLAAALDDAKEQATEVTRLAQIAEKSAKQEIERLKVRLHDAEAIGDFAEELRDRLALKEAADCVPLLQEENERLRAEVLEYNRQLIDAENRINELTAGN